MKTRIRIILALILGWLFVQPAESGVISSQNNTVDEIVIDGGRSGWSAMVAYTDDTTGENGIGAYDVDWNRVTVANASDQGTLYIRYELAKGADFNTYPAFYNMLIDTDRSRATGYIGGDGQLPIGADYLIQGANVFSFSGGSVQTAFGWTQKATLTTDNSMANRDIIMALPALLMGSPTAFHFVLLGDNVLSGNAADYYPDDGNKGVNGDYFEYTTKAGGSSVPGENP